MRVPAASCLTAWSASKTSPITKGFSSSCHSAKCSPDAIQSETQPSPAAQGGMVFVFPRRMDARFSSRNPFSPENASCHMDEGPVPPIQPVARYRTPCVRSAAAVRPGSDLSARPQHRVLFTNSTRASQRLPVLVGYSPASKTSATASTRPGPCLGQRIWCFFDCQQAWVSFAPDHAGHSWLVGNSFPLIQFPQNLPFS